MTRARRRPPHPAPAPSTPRWSHGRCTPSINADSTRRDARRIRGDRDSERRRLDLPRRRPDPFRRVDGHGAQRDAVPAQRAARRRRHRAADQRAAADERRDAVLAVDGRRPLLLARLAGRRRPRAAPRVVRARQRRLADRREHRLGRGLRARRPPSSSTAGCTARVTGRTSCNRASARSASASSTARRAAPRPRPRRPTRRTSAHATAPARRPRVRRPSRLHPGRRRRRPRSRPRRWRPRHRSRASASRRRASAASPHSARGSPAASTCRRAGARRRSRAACARRSARPGCARDGRGSTAHRVARMLLEALFAAAPEPMLVVDSAGTIRLANARAEELFGFEPGAMAGREVDSLVPAALDGRHGRHRASYAADPRTRTMGAGADIRARRADGSEFPVDVALGFADVDGEGLVIAIVRDITVPKRDRDELRYLSEHDRADRPVQPSRPGPPARSSAGARPPPRRAVGAAADGSRRLQAGQRPLRSPARRPAVARHRVRSAPADARGRHDRPPRRRRVRGRRAVRHGHGRRGAGARPARGRPLGRGARTRWTPTSG